MRLAAIDIGSNSIRLRVVEAPVGGARRTLDDEKAYARLGRGLAATGRLSEEAMSDAVDALRRMLGIAGRQGVTHVRAVATAAVRSAENGAEFVGRVRDELGLVVEVIPAEEEARLAFLSAAESVAFDGRCAVIDIGGGSMEVVQVTDGHIMSVASLPLGAVVTSERYHSVDPMPEKERKRLRKLVRRSLAEVLGEEFEPVPLVVGSGGTIATVAALVAAKREPGLAGVHTFELRRAEIVHLLAGLADSTAEERARTRGMSENRVDIIVAGAIVLDETMRTLGANELVVNARGMREGLVIDMIARERGVSGPLDRLQAAREFSRKFHTDAAHAEQVRRLALELFDQLAPDLGLDPERRYLLEAAAILHDVGYHIAYERHHKHTFHLISHADLPGFSTREVRLIATVARYHRGAHPKAGHEGMTDLGADDRLLVTRLAAILRLADGLDRSRGQLVRGLDARIADSLLTVCVAGEEPLDVEVHGATQKADLFARVFGVEVAVCDAGPGDR